MRKAAKQQDRVTAPEPTPEKGFYYRSDHFNFAKKGVPALYTKLGTDDREHGRAYGQQQQEDYVAKRYHQPSDEYSKDLDLSGSFEDLELMYRVGERVAGEKSWPEWYKNSEFRAVREAERQRALMTLAARGCHPRFATCSRACNQDETTARREAPRSLRF